MNEYSKSALRIKINELISRKAELEDMATQYIKRADIIRNEELIELDKQIEGLRSDLE